MAADALFAAFGAQRFVGGGLDPHLLGSHPQPRGDGGGHGTDVWLELGTLGHNHTVDVDHAPAAFSHQGVDLLEQHQAVGPLPLRVVRRKVLADVAQRQGPQQRIHDRVHQHVGIAVAIEPQAGGMLEPLAAQDQRPAGHQTVDVVAVADAQLHRCDGETPICCDEFRYRTSA